MIEVAAAYLGPALQLFNNVLCDVLSGVAPVPVYLNSGGKTQLPVGEIVNLSALRAASRINQAYGIRVDKSMKMYRTVLMQFRHQDIAEALPPDFIIEPLTQLLRDSGHIVPVDALRAQRERHKQVQVITSHQVEQTPPGPSGGPSEAISLLSGPTVAQGRRGFLGLPHLALLGPVDGPLPLVAPDLKMLAREDRPGRPDDLQNLSRWRQPYAAVRPRLAGRHRPDSGPIHTK